MVPYRKFVLSDRAAYAVHRGDNGKGCRSLTAIASGPTATKDSLKLDLLPLDGSGIVIRTPKDEREEGGE